MSQSAQDDIFEQLATFAETTYVYLMLVGQKRRMTEDELWLLDRATKAAAPVMV